MAPKTFAIEDLRKAVVILQGAVDENCSHISKTKRARIDEAVVNLINEYNMLRATIPIKPAIAPWIINPSGGWPVSEFDGCPVGPIARRKRMFDVGFRVRRREEE